MTKAWWKILYDFIEFTAESSSERIWKIGKHLAKLQTRLWCLVVFWTHSVVFLSSIGIGDTFDKSTGVVHSQYFLPCDAMHPRYYPWACVHVRLSVSSRCSIETYEEIELVFGV